MKWWKCVCVDTMTQKKMWWHTSRVFSEDVIQQSICCKFSNVLRGIVLIQGLQLSLALIELFMVSLNIIKNKDNKHSAIIEKKYMHCLLADATLKLPNKLTFSKAMRAWHSYTSTVNSVRIPWTWIMTGKNKHLRQWYQTQSGRGPKLSTDSKS